MLISTITIYYNPGQKPKQNIHKIAADRIINKYQIGDTVVFSNWQDAQLTNLYLKKQTYILQQVYSNKNTEDQNIFILLQKIH